MSIMIRLLCVFVVTLILNVKCITSQLKQERATMDYCNPKYVEDCYAITRRVRRGEPYKTNATITSKYAGDNNVTLKVLLVSGFNIELLKITVCEFNNIQWLYEFIKFYGGITSGCPYKPGKYGLYNLEFPPKNMPQRFRNLVEGKFYAKFFFQATTTEEILVESTILFQT